MKFSLWREEWIPVVNRTGATQCSLRDLFDHAHEITKLQHGNPLMEVAIFRLLLAILLDAVGPIDSDEWCQRWERGRFDQAEFRRYAAEVEARFDLLDPVAPFYQVAGLSTPSGEVKSTLLLFPELASGNNVPLFAAGTEAEPPLVRLQEAARRLLATMSFDVAGIKSGAVGDPQMAAGKTTGNRPGVAGQLGITIPLGGNLFESLMLNVPFPLADDSPDVGDAPVWRRDPQTAAWKTRPSMGLMDMLTWQSRRIRLVVDDEDDPQSVVGVIVAAGDRLEAVNPYHEAHTAWRATDPSERLMSQRPVRHQPGKAAWRGMDSLLALGSGDSPISPATALTWVGRRSSYLGLTYPLIVRTVGVVYGNQSAVVEHVLADATPLPITALMATSEGREVRDKLIGMAEAAEAIRKSLNRLLDNLRDSCGGVPVPWNKGDHPGDQFIAAIDGPTREFLSTVSSAPDEFEAAELEWEQQAWLAACDVAYVLIESAPLASFIGRDHDGDSKKLAMNQARAEAFFRGDLKKNLEIAWAELAQERKQHDRHDD